MNLVTAGQETESEATECKNDKCRVRIIIFVCTAAYLVTLVVPPHDYSLGMVHGLKFEKSAQETVL